MHEIILHVIISTKYYINLVALQCNIERLQVFNLSKHVSETLLKIWCRAAHSKLPKFSKHLTKKQITLLLITNF